MHYNVKKFCYWQIGSLINLVLAVYIIRNKKGLNKFVGNEFVARIAPRFKFVDEHYLFI